MKPWTEAEQAQHRADLLAALALYDRPRPGRPKIADRQRRNLRHMGLAAGMGPAAEQDHAPAVCPACLTGSHGPGCEGELCLCRCRSMLGLNGPPVAKVDAPADEDRIGVVA